MSNTKQLLLVLPAAMHQELKLDAVHQQRSMAAHVTRMLAATLGGTLTVGDDGAVSYKPKAAKPTEPTDHLWLACNGDVALYESLRSTIATAPKPPKSNLAAMAGDWDSDE